MYKRYVIKSLLRMTLIMLATLTVVGQVAFSQPINMIVDLDETGIATVHTSVVVNGAEALPCIGSCLYVSNYTGDVDYTIDNNTIVLVSNTESPVNVILSYVTTLSVENNGLWNASFYSPVNVTIILPLNAIPKDMTPLPIDVSVSNRRVVLLFPPGQVSITYTLARTIASSLATTTSITTSPTTMTTTTTTTTSTTTSTTTTATTPMTTNATATKSQKHITPVYAGIIALIVVAAIVTVFFKRR
jgi:hypothetical protein